MNQGAVVLAANLTLLTALEMTQVGHARGYVLQVEVVQIVTLKKPGKEFTHGQMLDTPAPPDAPPLG
jgi:hypothetical protein